jgi:putative ABC transport system permease protein
MTLMRMAWRYVAARPWLTLLNAGAVALGVMLIVVVLGLNRASREALGREAGLFDLVVGAKGSPLQLVLSAMYHLDIPTGNIQRSTADRLAADKRVAMALPLGLGDNFRGFRIVGTTTNLFSLTRGVKDRTPLLSVAEGNRFAKPFEAVLGAAVARQAGLAVGSTFSGTHGVVSLPGSETHDEFPYTVTGILESTGTAFDRAIYTPLESIWAVHRHEEAAHRPEGDTGSRAEDEVTAVLVQLKLKALRFSFAEEVREKTEAMAAIPIQELNRFFLRVLEPIRLSLLAVAWMVVVAATLSVLATLLQSAERRRRDQAILRCLGARPRHLLVLVLLEALWVTGLGVVAGGLAGHGLLHLAASLSQNRAGLPLDAWRLGGDELLAVGAVMVAGLLAGLIPGIAGYRRRPAQDLQTGSS